MFSLSVVDHLRLDSEHTDQNYTIHAEAAERFARLAMVARLAIASLLAAATAAASASLWLQTRPYAILTVVATAVALVTFALYVATGLEGRVHAHRAFAHRIWIVAERYRSLLSEIDEGQVDRVVLLQRRDDLIQQLHHVYEHGFGLDQSGHETARLRQAAPERAA